MTWRHFKHITLWGTMALTLTLIAACGGGSGSSGTSDTPTVTENIEIASQMSLVTAAEDTESPSINSFLNSFLVPTTGDYVDDVAFTYVQDESMKTLDTINNILCYLDQTRYADKVNEGPYIALIDATTCEHEGESSENQSSGQSVEYETWFVESTRASESDPAIVNFWVIPAESEDEENMDPFNEIRAEITIYAGSSDTNPYGTFTMMFVGYDSTGTTATMEGYLQVEPDGDNVSLTMVMDAGESMNEQVHAVINPDDDTGTAFASFSHNFETPDGTFTESDSLQIAFDENYFSTESDENGERCMDRVNFNENIWEYNLYDADGARKELNGGMGIKFPDPDDAGRTMYGYAGYWGIWTNNINLESGTEVTDDDDNVYTLLTTEGRVIKRTLVEMTLGDFVGDTFSMWDQDTYQNFNVTWDGTNLIKTGEQVCDETGCSMVEIEETVLTFSPYDWISLWKQGLGSANITVPSDGVIDNDTVVPVYAEEFLSPSSDEFASGDLTVKCYFNCLKPGITEEDLGAGTIYLDNIEDSETPAYTYTVDADTFALSYNGTEISLPDGVSLEGTMYSWGMQSGSMVPTTAVVNNPWEVWGSEVTYTYETGPNSWNTWSGLVDSNGDAVEFDPPMFCQYQSEEHGSYMLDYSGAGQLHGIPFTQQTDENTGYSYWQAEFTLDDGTELDCDGTPYYVRGMSIEQRMQEVDVANCADISGGSVSEPEDLFEDPEMDTHPDVENVDVIGGVLVTE